jgi:DNA-binding LacI/PurR family transcriptional regulator
MPRITQRDVATVMGVSVMTISNAFNRPDQLSPELRERVIERARKMGYTGPDALARQLRSRRTNTYAVVFEEPLSYAFSDPFSVSWLTGFSEVMAEHGASIMLLSVSASDPKSLDAVQDAAVDGLVGLCGNQPAIMRARDIGLPTVYCTLTRESDADSYVVIDDYAAGHDLGDHLRRLGHRRAAILIEGSYAALPFHSEYTPQGFLDAIEEGDPQWPFDGHFRLRGVIDGLGDADVRIVVAGPNSRESGHDAGTLVLDRADRPTAVVGMSDILALGLMDACAQRGLRVGSDISVVGFDDIPEAGAEGLTTIRQPILEKGRLAARLVLDQDRTDRQIVLPHQLVVRSSTGPAA